MTIPIREHIQQEVAEGGSALLTFTLQDEAEAPIPLAALGTLQLWLDDQATGATINGKTATNIKNLNGGTVHATTGAVTLALAPADNPILTAGKRAEWHLATIKGTYNGGAGVVLKEIAFKVVELAEI